MSLIANCLAKLVKQGKLSQQQADATTPPLPSCRA
jgi:hypothetical protein